MSLSSTATSSVSAVTAFPTGVWTGVGTGAAAAAAAAAGAGAGDAMGDTGDDAGRKWRWLGAAGSRKAAITATGANSCSRGRWDPAMESAQELTLLPRSHLRHTHALH